MSKDTSIVLLSEYNTRNTVNVKGTRVIVSVEPTLTLGDSRGMSSDYSADSAVAIFAEEVNLVDDFKAKKAIIASHSLIVTENKKFNFSGDNGVDSDISLTPGKSHDGQKGFDLFLYQESNDVTTMLNLNANGGHGGEGRVGVDGVIGSAGNGGNGGRIAFYSSSFYNKALSDIDGIIILLEGSDTNIKQIITQTTELVKSAPQDLKKYFNNVNDLLNSANPAIHSIKYLLSEARNNIDSDLTAYKSQQDTNIEVYGGKGGASADDKAGIDGQEGHKDVVMENTSSLLSSIMPPPSDFLALPVHPAQCTMLLNSVKLKYMLLNTNEETEFRAEVSDIAVILNRLIARTEPFVNLPETSALYKLYTDSEQKIGACNSITNLADICLKSKAYLSYLKQGLDFFGHQTNYVPLLQMSDLQTATMDLLTMFKTVEDYYTTYLQDLKDQNASINNIKALRDGIKSEQNKIQTEIKFLTENLRSIEPAIAPYAGILEKHKKIVTDRLEEFKDNLPVFDFDISNLLDAASMIAFAPGNPAMWGIEGAKVGYQGLTEIKNDQGIPVNKDFLVHQIDTIDGDLKTISEKYSTNSDGTLVLEDPGANKLIADQTKIDTLLNDFYSKFPSQVTTVKKAIQQYVNLVIERNNLVMQYNACATLLQEKYIQHEANEGKLSNLNDTFLDGINPDLPSISAFALETYNSTQNDVVNIMNMASRVYRLWTLDSENLCTIRDDSGTPPSALDYFTLSAVYENFYVARILNAIQGQPIMKGSFIPSRTTASYMFSNDDYFGDLKYGVSFSLSPQFKDQGGPFGEMSAVRINEVRVYLKDAKLSDGHHNDDIVINITHGVTDTFVTSTNQQVTFSYDRPKTMPFHYNIPNTTNFEVPIQSNISTHADFGIPSIEGGTEKYAVLSPFTSWTITVNDHVNPNLDYTSITGVVFEFYGVNSGFDL